jgi:hypothetical protein
MIHGQQNIKYRRIADSIYNVTTVIVIKLWKESFKGVKELSNIMGRCLIIKNFMSCSGLLKHVLKSREVLATFRARDSNK